MAKSTKNLPTGEEDKRNQQLERVFEKAIEHVIEPVKKNQSGDVDKLAVKIKDYFKEVENQRREIEQRWLKDLRQYRGQYDPDVLSRIHPNRSKAFVRITRTKVKTVDSRMVDLLFPANGNKNWNISPSVVPQLDEPTMQQIVQQIQQGGAQQITPDMLAVAIKSYADERAKKMGDIINDQLDAMKYRDVLRSVIHSGDLYGTGVLKGPMITLSKSQQYKQEFDEDGKATWALNSADTLMPYIESVPVWDFYPDMSAYDLRDCRFMIQRHKLSKRQLLDLAKRPDFNGEKIKDYLEKEREGDWEDKYFDTALKEIGDRSTYTSVSSRKTGRKYEILEYWGYLDSKDFEEMGAELPEKYKGEAEIAANVWVLGNQVLKIGVSHLGDLQWPFFLYYYDKDETSIFGEGIASILRDIQELINSSFRAMLDNAAISAGPQFEVNLDLLSEDEDPTDVRPMKVWLRTGEGADAANEAVRVKTVPSYTNEFLGMCKAFEGYADQITTIPQYMWGESQPGLGRTASGMSMLMGSANITIKDQVKNFDDGITRPFISAMYFWNMKFNEDGSIKGDYEVRAEGMASLVAKEVYSQSLMNFAQITNNPVDLPMVKRATILRKIADALDLGDQGLVLSEQEIQANQQAQQQAQQQERGFMSRMIETARKYGVSPEDMIENMRQAYGDQQQLMQQQAQQQGAMNG